MVKISTSILSVEPEDATRKFYDLEVAKTDYFHIDVMDGKFVEANTEEKMYEYTNTIKQISNLPLDVHFMVEDVKKNIDKYLSFEPDIITFHYEAFKNNEEIYDVIKYLKANNVKVGISIKPATPVEEILEFMKHIYLCLIMTVEPGKGGQKLIPETIEKVKKLKEYLEREALETFIEVDGGIKVDNAGILKNAGADIIVSGTAIISAGDMQDVIEKMKKGV